MQIIQNEIPNADDTYQKNENNNQKIEEICHQLHDICTVSYSIILPQCIYKRIKKRRVLKYNRKSSNSEEDNRENCRNCSIQNQNNRNFDELEEKIAIIDELQHQIKQLKAILGDFK